MSHHYFFFERNRITTVDRERDAYYAHVSQMVAELDKLDDVTATLEPVV